MATQAHWLEQLIPILGKTNITYDPDYASDASNYNLSGPYMVTPEHEDQVAAVLKFAAEHSLHVVPQGGGTKDAYGDTHAVDIILSLKKLTGVLHHSVGDLIVTVLPGTTLSELQTVLAQSGQFLPIDPANSEHATIGGIVASNASGPKRALYGSIRDHLIASRIAFPDGTIIRTGAKVVKNVAGYDMNKLFIGAMGTLGVFTELTFKIRPLPMSSGLIVLLADDLECLQELQALILDSHLEPCAFEYASASTFHVQVFDNRPTVIILFEDVHASVRYQMEWVIAAANRMQIDVLQTLEGIDQTEPMMEVLRSVVPIEEYKVIGLKLLTGISDVLGIVRFLEEIGDQKSVELRYDGGLYTGISHVRILVKYDNDDDQLIIQMIEQIRAQTDLLGGHTIIEHAPKSIRSVISVWGHSLLGLDIMRGIKQKFDPTNSLNRGRYVGGI